MDKKFDVKFVSYSISIKLKDLKAINYNYNYEEHKPEYALIKFQSQIERDEQFEVLNEKSRIIPNYIQNILKNLPAGSTCSKIEKCICIHYNILDKELNPGVYIESECPKSFLLDVRNTADKCNENLEEQKKFVEQFKRDSNNLKLCKYNFIFFILFFGPFFFFLWSFIFNK